MEDFLTFYKEAGKVPDACNGLELKEGYTEYNQDSCFWVFKSAGRPKIFKEPKSIRKRTDTIGITFHLKRVIHEKLKEKAYQMSLKAGYFVQINDLIREAIADLFPELQNKDLFGNIIRD